MAHSRQQGRVRVIAEAGVNHNGDAAMALDMVDVAAEAGADVVKFQTFRPREVIAHHAPKAAYQTRTTDAAESQLAMIEKLVLGEDDHRTLFERCTERGIDFLSSPFDLASGDFLTDTLGLATLKIPSGEITNAPLLLRAARSSADIILSTGMSTLDEVDEALGVLALGFLGEEPPLARSAFARAAAETEARQTLEGKVTLLHCTTEYPAPFEEVNLRAMDTLREAFDLPVGLSDHTPGIAVPVAAAALGATVVEKHFTLDRKLTGPDHAASVEPGELAAMVDAIRQIEQALGDGDKRPMPSEAKNAPIARKSLVARSAIHAGEPFTPDNLGVKRPGTGVSPMHYWDWIGRPATRDYAADEMIAP